MSTLPEIFKQAMILEQHLIESGGEISPELEKAGEEIMTQLEAKGESYALVIDRLGNSEDYYREQAEKYLKVAKGIANTRQYLKESLKCAMVALGREELSGSQVRIKLQKSPDKLELLDEAMIPSNMKKVIYETDKSAVKDALKKGENVRGARIVNDTHVRFYLNRGGK